LRFVPFYGASFFHIDRLRNWFVTSFSPTQVFRHETVTLPVEAGYLNRYTAKVF